MSPPFEEEVNAINSLQANLPYDLEYEKTKLLGDAFKNVFGKSPEVFKAGRYGVGANTSEIIQRLGYKVDCSVVPFLNMTNIQGPSFLGLPDQPYWFGDNQEMLEVPLTKGFAGNLNMIAPPLARILLSQLGEKLKFRGIASKLKLFDLINLTPEGYETEDLERILRSQMESGQKVLSLTYHSSSLKIDGSPYVKSGSDRKEFLAKIDRILSIFIHDYGVRVIPAINLYNELKR